MKKDVNELDGVLVEGTEIPKLETKVSNDEKPNLLDGYIPLDRNDLPNYGDLYPSSWNFAYRCPVAKEVANFSTISEDDQPGILIAVEDLIKKCVVIFDTESEKQISSGEINDVHRLYFLLNL